MDKQEIKEIEDVEEEIIEEEITESTLEEALKEAPMLENQEAELKTLKDENDELKAKILELEEAIGELSEGKEAAEEEKSLAQSIEEILEKKLNEVPERKGLVDVAAMEEKFTTPEEVEEEDDVETIIKKLLKMPMKKRLETLQGLPEEIRSEVTNKWFTMQVPFLRDEMIEDEKGE